MGDFYNWFLRLLSLRLFHLDAMTHHPEFLLFQASLPAGLELFHPLAALGRVGRVHRDPPEVVRVEYPALPPVAFKLLGLVTGRSEVIHDLQDRFGKPFGGHIPPVIELEGEQPLESPPFAAHRWSFLGR